MFTSLNWRIAISGITLIAFVVFAVTSALSPYADPLFETIMGVPSSKTEILFQPRVLKDERWEVPLTVERSEQVVIYENDLVTIRINQRRYAAYQAEEQTGSDKPVDYPTLEELAKEAGVQFRNGTPDYHEHRFLIALLLKSGTVTVSDKRSQTSAAFITVRDYVFTCGPVCGLGSWIFYLPDGTVFYETDYLWN